MPRPETEVVAQLAIDALKAAASPAPIAVDLGTGSGAIALALATEVPHARVFAAENSVDAFVWTKENFAHVGADNATLAFIDLEHAFPELDGTVSVVVSNPPYVPDAAIPRDPEVRFFDPPAALYGGEDGLDVVRVLSGVGLRLAHPGRHDRDRARRVAGRGDPRDPRRRRLARRSDASRPHAARPGHDRNSGPDPLARHGDVQRGRRNLEWVRHVPHLRLP